MTFKRTTCKHCKAKLDPARPKQIVHVECIEGWVQAQADKRKRAEAKTARMAAKVDRAITSRRKEALKTRSEWMREAQQAFNAFIRARDQAAGHACISSGRPLNWSGNQVDAGHYRSVGSAPHLRFNEDNCHAQSKHDNQWLSGNAVDYRLGLIARIGIERVEAVEVDSTVCKWTVEDLRGIRDEYRSKLKQLKERGCE